MHPTVRFREVNSVFQTGCEFGGAHDPCRLQMPRHSIYKKILEMPKERPGALLLDVGCCFGTDVRKAVLDGFPPSQVIASDIEAPVRSVA